MYKSAMKCNETLGKWCKNKHGASKIMDTFETDQTLRFPAYVTLMLLLSSWVYQIVAVVA
jgi:hypothetical protein